MIVPMILVDWVCVEFLEERMISPACCLGLCVLFVHMNETESVVGGR
jgi:hypothetical protein